LGSQCAGITGKGDRCKRSADGPNGFCWLHDPANAEQRRRIASKAGRGSGSKEITAIRCEVRTLIEDVREGALPTGRAAVMIQGYNCLLRAEEITRRVRETEDLIEELEALKREFSA
jgi:hypothetical protein